MIRYKNTPSIEFDLNNGYNVKAEYIYDKNVGRYFVSLYIQQKNISMWDLMENAENIEFDSDNTTIKTDIAHYVTTLLTDGFFKYYIDRYQYIIDCFDKGDEFFANKAVDKDDM